MNLLVTNVRINRQNLTDGAKLQVFVPADISEVRQVMSEHYGYELTADNGKPMTAAEIIDCCVRTEIFYRSNVQYDLQVTSDNLLYRNNQYFICPDMIDHKFNSYKRLEVTVYFEEQKYVLNDYNMLFDDEDLTAAVYMTLVERLDLTYKY